MRNSFIRKIGAMFVLLSLWATVISLPLNVSAQTDSSSSTKDDKKNKKDKKQKEQKTTVQTNGKAPLSVNEDPSMIGKRKINKGFDKFFGWLGGSQEKEIALGRQLSAEVEAQTKLVDDPIINEYVNRVGQNIVLHSDAKLPFTIKVIDSDEVNAFALPGGFFYVNKGLILAADNEAELAGVMAHEIAHVTARHAMENQGKGTAINYGMLAGIIFGGGIISPILQNGGGIIGALGMLKFSRGAEEEADRLGVQYMYAAGYDPTAMATMFEKLASQRKKKPGTLAKLFSTHPQSIDRRDASLALAARFPEKEEYVISTSEYQRIKGKLLKTSNAKASTISDIDEGEDGKPTLKRRQPVEDSNDGSSTPSSSSSSDDEKPQLKRRDAEPKPTPTPQN
jgi:beta-barrel assembly-enhancing protease